MALPVMLCASRLGQQLLAALQAGDRWGWSGMAAAAAALPQEWAGSLPAFRGKSPAEEQKRKSEAWLKTCPTPVTLRPFRN